MNNKGQGTTGQQFGGIATRPPLYTNRPELYTNRPEPLTFKTPLVTIGPPTTNGVNNVKQLNNNPEAESKKTEQTKKAANKAHVSFAKPSVTYATIGCQTDRTIDNYGAPTKAIEASAQAQAQANCGLNGKGCARKRSRKRSRKANQTNGKGKNESNQTKKPAEAPPAQPNQSQTKKSAQQAGKQKPAQTDGQQQTLMKPNQVKKQQPSQLKPLANHNGRSLVGSGDGQARFEACVRVNMSVGPQERGSPKKKYTSEQLMAQMARLDMNNNQPPELAKFHSEGNKILSNISQLELRAELLVNSVPFRMPNST